MIKKFILLFLLLCSFSSYGGEAMPLDEKSKTALANLSDEELCDSIADELFKSEKNLCISWETNARGVRKSCLDWGVKVNKQNYINELNARNHPADICGKITAGRERQALENEKQKKKEFEKTRQECEDNPPIDTRGMKICLAAKITLAEEKLKATYLSLSKALEKYHTNKADPSPVEALANSQSSWEEYKEDQCQIGYRVYYRGSIAGLELGGCRLHMTNERISELNKLSERWNR